MTQIKFSLAIILFLAFTACDSSETNNTKLSSDNYKTKEERTDALKKEVIVASEIKDAEFELFNVNGFQKDRAASVPGSSSVDYKFLVKVDTSDIMKWTLDMVPSDSSKYDDFWVKQLLKDTKGGWQTKSSPSIFVRPESNTTVLVYRKEGIICKRIILD